MAADAVIQELSSSSDDDMDGGAGILSLADDPDFTDVRPLDLSEPERPVVAIQYGDEARQRLAYLYALAAAGEVSKRTFRLTAQVIGDNPANYTAWICRWRCLRAGCGSKVHVRRDACTSKGIVMRTTIHMPLGDLVVLPKLQGGSMPHAHLSTCMQASELAFLHSCTLASGAKNYQLWNHRRRIALQLGALNIAEEMRFAADCQALEPKNYHAWAHRQAVLLAAAGAAGATEPAAAAADGAAAAECRPEGSRAGHSGSHGGDGGCSEWWAAELDYVDACIAADVRDNSAWAQRFFLLSNSSGLFADEASSDGSAGGVTYDAVANHELAFTARQLQRGAHNGSVWNYLRGLLTLPGGGDAWVHDGRLPKLCCQMLAEEPSCGGALELLADVYAARAAAAAKQQEAETARIAAAHAAALWRELALVDPVRRRFWDSRLTAKGEGCPAQQ